MEKDRICVVGGGFVGLTTALAFVHHGRRVVLVEVIPDKRVALASGQVPFHEPGLDDALPAALASGNLEIVGDLTAAVSSSCATFLCVGTPSRDDGSIDLRFVAAAARDVGRALEGRTTPHLVVVKSTVLPGTTVGLVRQAVEETSHRTSDTGVSVASNPEFLAEGTAYRDALEPERIVLGTLREEDRELLASLYEGFPGDRLAVDPTTAETIKYASNSFLAARVALSNEFANLCADVGVDWYTVADAIGRDPRIGPMFLRAGAGFGGSCFPKDVRAVTAFGRERGQPLGILEAVLANNEAQPLVPVRLLEEALGGLAGKRVALLGLAFKADTDDVRETRAQPIWRALRAAGAEVLCHDPMAGKTFGQLEPEAVIMPSIDAALQDADGCILQTEWKEYQAITPEQYKGRMNRAVVVDGRRIHDPVAMRAAGVDYRAVGLGLQG